MNNPVVSLKPVYLVAFLVAAASPNGGAAVIATTFVSHPFEDDPEFFSVPADPSLYVGFNTVVFGSTGGLRTRDLDIDGDGNPEIHFYGVSNGFGVTAYEGTEVLSSAIPAPFIDEQNLAIPLFRNEILGPDADTLYSFQGIPPTLWNDHTTFPHLIGEGNASVFGGYFPGQTQSPFLALRFEREGEWHYAWVQVTPFPAASGFIGGWAWETEANKPIIVGVIPESSAVFLSLFGLTVVLLRRR